MELNQFGNFLLKFLCIYHFPLLSRMKCLVYMVVYHLKFNNLIKLNLSIEFKIYHIMDHYVIYFGQILLIKANQDLDHRLEVLDIVGEKMSVINLPIKTI